MLDELFQDFRISVRGLLRTPLFAVTVILTPALGIGTNTAIFSIVDWLLLRLLPNRRGYFCFRIRSKYLSSTLTFSRIG